MAFDCFLKIEEIPGESTDDEHGEWIEVLSFSHGVSQKSSGAVSSGGSLSAERCDHQDFSIVKTLDKASPKLNLFCCNGREVDEVKVELCRSGGDKQKYMEYIMTKAIITSVRPGGSSQGADPLPLEEVTFKYRKIDWIYTPESEGAIPAFWDLETNKGG